MSKVKAVFELEMKDKQLRNACRRQKTKEGLNRDIHVLKCYECPAKECGI